MSAIQDWIRPWYPAGLVGHIYADCPSLLDVVPEPVEGPGWLDPNAELVHPLSTCGGCLARHKAKRTIC